MGTCLLVGNGVKNPLQFLKDLSKKADFIIGVDAGTEALLEAGVRVDLAIGDFDSLKNKNILKGLKYLEYPKDKDYSDTDLAVIKALSLNYDEIILTNMLGGRTDHTLFNISILYKILKKGKTGKILENQEEIYIFDKEIRVEVKLEDTVSLFPLSGTLSFETSTGLFYSLENKSVNFGEALTLSNYAVSEDIYVELKAGIALLLLERKCPLYP
jgi:thiamine pyrophosphokinase